MDELTAFDVDCPDSGQKQGKACAYIEKKKIRQKDSPNFVIIRTPGQLMTSFHISRHRKAKAESRRMYKWLKENGYILWTG